MILLLSQYRRKTFAPERSRTHSGAYRNVFERHPELVTVPRALNKNTFGIVIRGDGYRIFLETNNKNKQENIRKA